MVLTQSRTRYVLFIMLTLLIILTSSPAFGSTNHNIYVYTDHPRSVLIGENVSLIIAIYINDTIENTDTYNLYINITYIANNTSIEYHVRKMNEYYLVSFIPQNVGAYVVNITVEITIMNSNISRTKYIVINAYKQDYDDITSKLNDIDEELDRINETLIKINNSLISQLNQLYNNTVIIKREVVNNISKLIEVIDNIRKDIELLAKNVSILSNDIVYRMNRAENNSRELDSRLSKVNKTLLDLVEQIGHVIKSTNDTLNLITKVNQSISASIADKYSVLDNKLILMTNLAGLSMGSVLLLIILFTLGVKKVVH